MTQTSQNKPLTGWPLLPYPTGGSLRWPTFERSVRETVRVILSTQAGEQLMQPQFGAGLQQFIHQENTITTRRRIHDAIVTALSDYEQRVTVERVDVDPAPGQPWQVLVTVTYRLLRTGAIEQIGATVSLRA